MTRAEVETFFALVPVNKLLLALVSLVIWTGLSIAFGEAIAPFSYKEEPEKVECKCDWDERGVRALEAVAQSVELLVSLISRKMKLMSQTFITKC